MGFFDTLTDLIEAAVPWSQVEAEAPATEKKDEEADATVCTIEDDEGAIDDCAVVMGKMR
jgi:ubiquinol-cytochrome c reductase subunit 6